MSGKFFLVLFALMVTNRIAQTRNFGGSDDVRKGLFKALLLFSDSLRFPPYSIPNYFHASRQNVQPTSNQFLNYWHNILRNVRVPVPTISWNVTNPLTSLFTMGGDQPIRSEAEGDKIDSENKVRQKKRRRKGSHKKRHRKNEYKIEDVQWQQENELNDKILLQPYPDVIYPNAVMYFYDPATDGYYAVQRVKALGPYVDGVPFNYALDAYNEDPTRKRSQSQQMHFPISEILNKISNPEIAAEGNSSVEIETNLDELLDVNKIELPAKNLDSKDKPTKTAANEETVRDAFGDRNTYNSGQRNALKHKPNSNMKYLFLLNKN